MTLVDIKNHVKHAETIKSPVERNIYMLNALSTIKDNRLWSLANRLWCELSRFGSVSGYEDTQVFE